MIQHEPNDGRMEYNIYFYQNMQYQVKPIHQTEENGQKADFWLFGSFKMNFSDFLMIQYELYNGQIIETKKFHQNIEYQVNPMHPTQEIF